MRRHTIVFCPSGMAVDFNIISYRDWPRLIAANPEFADKCDLSGIDGSGWVEILKAHPEFSKSCAWDKLDGNDVSELLRVRPEFSDRCDKKTMSGSDWAWLLADRPQFAAECNWKQLDGIAWAELLAKRPEFAEHCVWEKLGSYEWVTLGLLEKQPDLAVNCNWNLLDRGDWLELLKKDAKFAAHCRWELLTGEDWTGLLSRNSEFAAYCDWLKLGPYGWLNLISRKPEFVDKCDWSKIAKCGAYDTRRLVADHPEFRRFLPEVDCGISPNMIQGRFFDVYLCCCGTVRKTAERIAKALEERKYSVYLNDGNEFDEADRLAMDMAGYFLLIRSEGLFDELLDEVGPIAEQVRRSLSLGTRLVSVGPSDQKWQDDRSLPEDMRVVETDQVKNIDMGDLFDEKIDALVRESMLNCQGSLAKKYDLFISYRRKTGGAVARRLQQQLKEFGYQVFLDSLASHS